MHRAIPTEGHRFCTKLEVANVSLRQFERLASTRTPTANVRTVAATHRDLHRAIVAGNIREDLYYRLSVFPITVPPLRDLPSDIRLVGLSTIHCRVGCVSISPAPFIT